MNDFLQDAINGLALRSPLLDSVMRFSALDLVFLIAATPPLLWFFPSPGRRAANQRAALAAVAAVPFALLAARLAGMALHQPRPFISDGDTRLLVHHSADNSFPSDHVTLAFAVAGAFVASKPSLGLPLCALGLLIGVARVFVGVHWPDDILAGIAIGLSAGYVAGLKTGLWAPVQHRLSRILPPLLVAPP